MKTFTTAQIVYLYLHYALYFSFKSRSYIADNTHQITVDFLSILQPETIPKLSGVCEKPYGARISVLMLC